MTYYRLHSNLTIGDKIVKAQTVSKLEEISDKKIDFLLEREHISRILFPPIDQIPQLESLTDELEFVGVTSIEKFLDLCSYDLSFMLNVENDFIDNLQSEVWSIFVPIKTGCNCGDSRSLNKG